MHRRDRCWVMLGGLLALTGACKDEAAEPEASKPEAASPDVGSEPSAVAKVVKEAVAPEPPPPTGHAVAKVGSLFFQTSTGDVGFELPPLDKAPGLTINVVGAKDGRLAVELLSTNPLEHHCTASLKGLEDFRLRMYMASDDLLPVLAKDFSKKYEDGTELHVSRGVPLGEVVGPQDISVLGTTVRVDVGADSIGLYYEPGTARELAGNTSSLPPKDGHSLLYGSNILAEKGLHETGYGLAVYGVEAATSGYSRVKLRNRCVEVVAQVSDERLHAPPPTVPSGVLGVMAAESGHFLASPYGGAFAVGSDDEDVWGGLTGTEVGEAYGVGGLGLVGTGRSTPTTWTVHAGTEVKWADGTTAGLVTKDHEFDAAPRDEGGHSCFDLPLNGRSGAAVVLCFSPSAVSENAGSPGGGTIGLGSTGLIGRGTGGGTGSGYGRGSGAGFGGRGKRVPRVRQAKAKVVGSLDKDIIRRIVRAHINEVRSCYNKGLTKDPTLEGRVAINFVITSAGKVGSSVVEADSMGDPQVAKCIAKAVKRWKFPKPRGGGNVIVTYPFVMSPG
ncbi:MAG: AgmX/PglI C-terminal domain-containing protein [Myxococcota bacterium]